MAKRYIRKPDEMDENVFWTTMSDMFLGLMMVFMTLFIFAMTGYSELKIEAQRVQSEIASELSQKLKKIDNKIDVDLMNCQVKISDVDLFDVGSYELSQNGKALLNKIMPVYFETIFENEKFSDRILNVLIQGHSDSQGYKDANSKEETFIKNLDLSTKRAISVESYIFSTGYNKKYTNKLFKCLVAEGKSNSEPVIENGKENFAKSRRVEFKLVLRDPEITDVLDKILKEKSN